MKLRQCVKTEIWTSDRRFLNCAVGASCQSLGSMQSLQSCDDSAQYTPSPPTAWHWLTAPNGRASKIRLIRLPAEILSRQFLHTAYTVEFLVWYDGIHSGFLSRYCKPSGNYLSPLLLQLQWLKAPERIQCKLAALTFIRLHGTESPNLADEFLWSSALEARGRLRSALS